MQTVKRSLFITTVNRTLYYTCTGRCEMEKDDQIADTDGSKKTGSAILTAAAMNELFPNSTAHPSRVFVQWTHRQKSTGSNPTPYTALFLGGTEVKRQENTNEIVVSFDSDTAPSSTKAAALSLTRSSTIYFFMQVQYYGWLDYKWVSIGGDTQGYNGNTFDFYFPVYDISASKDSGIKTATVTPSTGYEGDVVTFKCEANPGYTFEGWYNGNTKVSGSPTYKHTISNSDVTLTAKAVVGGKSVFAIGRSGISSAKVAKNGGTAYEAAVINNGDTLTFTCTVASGYTFDGWYSDGTKVSSNQTYTMNVTTAYNFTLAAQTTSGMRFTTPFVDPERIKEIKARVKAECLRRAYSGSVAAYGGADYDFSHVPDEYKKTVEEHARKNLVPLNAINKDKFPTTYGDRIFRNNDLLEEEAFLAVAETTAKTNSTHTDCSGGCTGLCYGCTGTCTGSCTSCSGTCSGGCKGSCSGGCTSCSGGCSGGCDGGCSGCGSGCSGSCTSGCDGSCTAKCANTCTSSCYGNCSTVCNTNCVGGCKSGCSNTCSGSCSGYCKGIGT